jgi:alpha-N-arabinofuranosidase
MPLRAFTTLILCALSVAACSTNDNASPDSDIAQSETFNAVFDWFEYSGRDELFDRPLEENNYRNPIIAGYHPDPSVTVAGDNYYLVNSTFGFYPGIPVFHSRDLVNWTQIANAIDRPDMMPFDNLVLGQNGVYAPTIDYYDVLFYIMNTCVACGGNFVLTASDPAGPWSDPIWLPHIGGIDPSLFIDDDGSFYVVHHDNPETPLYMGHTLIKVVQVDPVTFDAISDGVLLIDGADETPWNTIWIEGPHIYKIDGQYLLSAPGGGTGYYHQQLAFKSDSVFGPYQAFEGNPILTQSNLSNDRPDAVSATGHADMFEDSNGDWWAVFLGTRVFDLDVPPQDPGRFLTGRETFMLPVEWVDGWPIILPVGEALPTQVENPQLPLSAGPYQPTTGNFTRRIEFDETLGLQWLYIRTPKTQWWSISDSNLHLSPRSDRVGQKLQPSFVGQRLAHMSADISTHVSFRPRSSMDEAGLLALQNDRFYYTFGLSVDGQGEPVLRVRGRQGEDQDAEGDVLGEMAIDPSAFEGLELRIKVDIRTLSFEYSLDGETFVSVLEDVDSSPLSTARAGGFTGAVIGPYAQSVARDPMP